MQLAESFDDSHAAMAPSRRASTCSPTTNNTSSGKQPQASHFAPVFSEAHSFLMTDPSLFVVAQGQPVAPHGQTIEVSNPVRVDAVVEQSPLHQTPGRGIGS